MDRKKGNPGFISVIFFFFRFLEVYVNTPLHICRKRDPKHLYEMAEREILSGFLNEDANDLYEEPTSHELTVDTVNALPQNSVQTITDYLEKKKYLYCKKVKNLTQDTCHVWVTPKQKGAPLFFIFHQK